ncbi:MAG: DUF72 domain-containing protein [Actinomycetota bacterium]|nr:DUF72 domain-containing protein [Actinomycetota bacterium]
MGDVVLGTCSWADKTMIEAWYPPGVSSAEARLRYYAERFDSVEVDSTFYGLPRREYAENWARRTPEGFVFHVKAYGLMTGHEVDERSLHPDLREYPFELTQHGRVRNAPVAMVERAFELFVSELEPLRAAGKLGGVLMQYPPYITATDPKRTNDTLERIEVAQQMLDGLPLFVEFRHNSWVTGRHLGQTMKFLADRQMTYVAVDAPQLAGGTTMPPITAATAPWAYVRFHGRNREMWNARTSTAAERFDYLYTAEELGGWAFQLKQLAEDTERTWVMFNNCRNDYAPRNAREMAEILGDIVAPRHGGVRTGEPAPSEAPLSPAPGQQLGLSL